LALSTPPAAASIWKALVLTGQGFAPGDEVEFVDTRHAVRVAAEFLDPDRLRVQVPAAIQSGFARVSRGALRSNPQAFNAPAS